MVIQDGGCEKVCGYRVAPAPNRCVICLSTAAKLAKINSKLRLTSNVPITGSRKLEGSILEKFFMAWIKLKRTWRNTITLEISVLGL